MKNIGNKFVIIDNIKYSLLREIIISNTSIESVYKYKAVSVEENPKYVLLTRVFKNNTYTWSLSSVFKNKEEMDSL